MQRIFRLFATVLTCAALASAAHGATLDWQLDPTTGYAVAQLTQWDPASTADTEDNYALYHHHPNQSDDGRFLVYRNLECSSGVPDVNSLSYRRLDLETGAEVQLTTTGYANGGIVNGDYLYVMERPHLATNLYTAIYRIDLATQTKECVVAAPTGERLLGGLTVNVDGTVVVYQTRQISNWSAGSATWAREIGSSLGSTCPSGDSDTQLDAWDPGIEHVVFSPTDPKVFAFVDQAESQLSRLGIGTYDPFDDSSTWNQLDSDQDYLDSFAHFSHPFWGPEGYLWGDSIGPSLTAYEESFVRFEIDEASGCVDVYRAVEKTLDDWHHHQAGNRSVGWYVGDGRNDASRPGIGLPYISLFQVELPATANSVGGSLDSHLLADSLGNENAGPGNGGANAHLLETLDGVTFTAPYDFDTGEASDVGGCQASRNVFLVKIPPRFKAGIDDEIVGGTADGPWKHASRLSVSTNGQSWQIDYGAAGASPTLGDGTLDHSAGRVAFFPDHSGLADLDGDDVDDRLSFEQLASGWQIQLAYTPYDGVLSTGPVTPDSTRSYPDASSRAPIFGDLDGDGRDDMVRLDDTGTSLLWQGKFSAGADLPAEPYVAFGGAWETAAAFGSSSLDQHAFAADVDGDGHADRIVVRASGSGWLWQLDLSSASGWGDGVVDDSFLGGSNTLDVPLVADTDADGRADIVIARRDAGAGKLRWYVNPSSGGGFGSTWDPPAGRGHFGDDDDQPLIARFGRFTTVEP